MSRKHRSRQNAGVLVCTLQRKSWFTGVLGRGTHDEREHAPKLCELPQREGEEEAEREKRVEPVWCGSYDILAGRYGPTGVVCAIAFVGVAVGARCSSLHRNRPRHGHNRDVCDRCSA